MGVVYAAEDLRLGRRVALMFLPDDLAQDPQALERFRREARAAGSQSSQHLPYLRHRRRREPSYIVMEYLEGTTLKYRVEGKPLAVEQLVDLGAQMTRSMWRTPRASSIAI